MPAVNVQGTQEGTSYIEQVYRDSVLIGSIEHESLKADVNPFNAYVIQKNSPGKLFIGMFWEKDFSSKKDMINAAVKAIIKWHDSSPAKKSA
jgi:hypothetical protein